MTILEAGLLAALTAAVSSFVTYVVIMARVGKMLARAYGSIHDEGKKDTYHLSMDDARKLFNPTDTTTPPTTGQYL